MDSKAFNPVVGVRHRVIRNGLRQLGLVDLPTLGPGQMQLYSYYTPGLTTGLYEIKTEQNIDASGQKMTISSPAQPFLVTAPRFSIDSSLIHSTFPLSGVTAHSNILPHIVFTDPHLPWQTAIGKTNDNDPMRIPWLAVVAFEQSELQMSAEDTVFPPDFQPPKPSFTMATNMTLDALTKSNLKCAVPNLDELFAEDSTLHAAKVDVIFPKMDLFLNLFSDSVSPPSIDLDRYKYLAHARQVNTVHMTDAGVIDEGTFSIVLSHRTGPTFSAGSPTTPKHCVVHVVSLDAINNILQSSLTENGRAALISLYSWTYDCLPPEAINFEDIMRKVAMNNYPFGTPREIHSQVGQGLSPAVQSRIQDRIDDGYTLLRYRVQTGEETVAFTRGPLTPARVPDATWLDIHSNTGEDLQIIDSKLGIIDISYCTAWQLGKSLAIADQAFCAALLRIRAEVHNNSTEQEKQDILSQHFEPATSDRVISSLSKTVKGLSSLASESPSQKRWSRPSLVQSHYQYLEDINQRVQPPEAFVGHTVRSLHTITSAAGDDGHYTEFKDPASTDWSLVLNWLLDRIYLEGIPSYYLIPDSTWLPTECVRFFYVDHKWLSAIVDGALSVANHLDHNDITRQAIKAELLKYLTSEIHPELKHPPQVPSYGFYLRSVAVDVFQDLVVRAPWPDPADPRAEVLKQVNVRKDIMFCLLDRMPEKLDELIISQPPHQQCFAFGHDGTLTDESFSLSLRKVYSTITDKSMAEIEPPITRERGSDGRCDIYDWNWHTVRMDALAKLIFDTLQEARKTDADVYNGPETNAALMGIELNDPIYRLIFHGKLAPAMEVSGPGGPHSGQPVFALPADAATTAPVPVPSESGAPRPFKIKPPRQALRPPGPPRRTNKPLPSLVSIGQIKLAEGQEHSPHSGLSTLTLTHTPDFDNLNECSPRFSPLCFTRGHVPSPIPGDNDSKIVLIDKYGTDIIFRLIRNSNDADSTDSINYVQVTIPLGSASGCLLKAAPGLYGARMLSNIRMLPLIRSDPQTVIVELKPKAISDRTSLAHNKDISFVITGAIVNDEAKDVTISITELYRSEQGNAKVAPNWIHYVNVENEISEA